MTCQRVVFLTQHGKESLVAPVLEARTQRRVELVSGFDTDLLGTFGRDIARPGTQIEAARRKARIGMDLGQCPRGIASEGAFVQDPYTGMIPWNVEVIVYIDDEAGVEVIGVAQGAAMNAQVLASDPESLQSFATEAAFPAHHVMLRPDSAEDTRIWKGISDWDALHSAFHQAKAISSNGKVFVESDLRAFCNPTRQNLIRSAAEDLARKLDSECPQCNAPGYWTTDHIAGLPCRQCLTPTRVPIAQVWSCKKCGRREERRLPTDAFADPSKCDFCNP